MGKAIVRAALRLERPVLPPEFSVELGDDVARGGQRADCRSLTGSIDGFLSADYSYIGDSVALLNGGYGAEAERPGYSLANLRFGVSHEKQEVSLNIHNLSNAKPNLGDIGYVGYAQYQNYAAGTIIPQVATLQPLSVILQYKQSF